MITTMTNGHHHQLCDEHDESMTMQKTTTYWQVGVGGGLVILLSGGSGIWGVSVGLNNGLNSFSFIYIYFSDSNIFIIQMLFTIC
jgi:hypothetical protein